MSKINYNIKDYHGGFFDARQIVGVEWKGLIYQLDEAPLNVYKVIFKNGGSMMIEFEGNLPAEIERVLR